MVSVWETFGLEEEIFSFLLVEFSSHFFVKWHMNDVEVTVFSESQPCFEWSSLNSVGWPVPGILRFNDIKFSIESHSHD
jgi:hypothetical protein